MVQTEGFASFFAAAGCSWDERDSVWGFPSIGFESIVSIVMLAHENTVLTDVRSNEASPQGTLIFGKTDVFLSDFW